LARAKELDDYFKTNNKLIGLLLGLPVTLTGQFYIKDLETSVGFVGWIGTFDGKKGMDKERPLSAKSSESFGALAQFPIGKVMFSYL